jgi:hypothetical protein
MGLVSMAVRRAAVPSQPEASVLKLRFWSASRSNVAFFQVFSQPEALARDPRSRTSSMRWRGASPPTLEGALAECLRGKFPASPPMPSSGSLADASGWDWMRESALRPRSDESHPRKPKGATSKSFVEGPTRPDVIEKFSRSLVHNLPGTLAGFLGGITGRIPGLFVFWIPR